MIKMNLDRENKDFIRAVELIQNTNESFFLTGKAGTGKSSLLKYIVEEKIKNYILVAPTGVSAVNIGGVTIQSFFQFPLRPLLPEDEGIKVFSKDSEKHRIISEMDTLIIDEVSMVRADLIDGIDYSLRINGGNANLPFGGKQIVFVGDVFQLEPVMIKKSGEHKILTEIYSSPYFFQAKVFRKVNLYSVELKKVYRQNNLEFISLLNKIRLNEITQADVDKINTRVLYEMHPNNKEFAITLTTTNESADLVNKSKLDELKSNLIKYEADISGVFDQNKYPTEPIMELKKGAQVIFIKNDTDKRWVNGTIGQIFDLTTSSIKVKLNNGEIHSVDKRVWENIRYRLDKQKKKIKQEIIGTFRQYPLRLAWAVTIHKSQGLTFDKVVVDFTGGTFASGQAYVALSRARSFEGLFLKKEFKKTDIYLDEELKEFERSQKNKSIAEKKLEQDSHRYDKTRNNGNSTKYEHLAMIDPNELPCPIEGKKRGSYYFQFDKFRILLKAGADHKKLSGIVEICSCTINGEFYRFLVVS